jgi:hypothetical protein
MTQGEARAYLERHGVREMMERVVEQLVRARPDDVAAFAADALLRGGSTSLPAESSPTPRSTFEPSLSSSSLEGSATRDSGGPQATGAEGAAVAIVGIGCRYPAGSWAFVAVFCHRGFNVNANWPC